MEELWGAVLYDPWARCEEKRQGMAQMSDGLGEQ